MSQIKFIGGKPGLALAPVLGNTAPPPILNAKVPFVKPTQAEDSTPVAPNRWCGLDVGGGCVLEVEQGGIVLEVDRYFEAP